MPSITVNSTKEAEEIIQRFIDTFVEEYAKSIQWNAKVNLTINKSIGFGDLRENIKIEKTSKGYNVVADRHYASAVEYGTFPHWVPLKALEKWAMRKFGRKDVAYFVQKKIAEKGTKAKPYMEPAVESAYDEAIIKAMAKVGA